MIEKRFKNVEEKLDWGTIQYFTYNDEKLTDDEIEDLVNQLLEENDNLKKENQMLKHTIGRNESYIARLTHTGVYNNTTKPYYRSISRGD